MATIYDFPKFFSELGIVSTENSQTSNAHIVTLKDGQRVEITGKELRDLGVTMTNLMNLIKSKINGN